MTRFLFVTSALVCLSFGAFAQSEINVTDIARSANEVCDDSGKGYRFTADGELSGEARATILKKLLGVEGEVEGALGIEAWDGVQQVLREHAADDKRNKRDCVRDLIPQLLEFERERMQSERKESNLRILLNAPTHGEQPCFEISGNHDLPLPVYRDMCLTDLSGRSLVVILRADSQAVSYVSATGIEVNCKPGDSCGFGWKGGPHFTVAHVSGRPLLVGVN